MKNNDRENIKLSFKKAERLCSRKIIEKLFSDGKSILSFPVKIVFLQLSLSTSFPAQAGFSVGKKIFKKAVQRNLLKRRMREAYRLNKNDLYQKLGDKQLALFIVFIGKTTADYTEIELSIRKGIKKVIKEIS